MTAYTVHEPNRPGLDAVRRAEAIAFVKDGFAWLALLFPLLWLIFHRMWLELVAFVVVLLALDLALAAIGASQVFRGWAGFAAVLIFAFQANDLRRWRLDRAGYRMVSAITGRNRDEAELRFFEDWVGRDQHQSEHPDPARPPLLPAVFPPRAQAPGRSDDPEDVIGLFPRG